MKFFHSKNYTYRSRKLIPKSWIDYGLNESKTLHLLVDRELRIYDADICGDKTIYVIFSNGKAYELTYSWWIQEMPEWKLIDEYYYEEIPLKKAIENGCMLEEDIALKYLEL